MTERKAFSYNADCSFWEASRDAVIGFKLSVWSTKSRHLILAPQLLPLPLFLFICANTQLCFYQPPLLSLPAELEQEFCPCFHPQFNAHAAPHICGQTARDRRAGGAAGVTPGCVCVCEIRRDKGEVARRGTGSGRTQAGYSFHLHTIAKALVHSAHKYTPVPLLRLNLRRSLGKFASADQQQGGKKRKIERAGEIWVLSNRQSDRRKL